jgi:hypothetical protein
MEEEKLGGSDEAQEPVNNEVEFEPGYASHRFIKKNITSLLDEIEAYLMVNELLHENGIQTT